MQTGEIKRLKEQGFGFIAHEGSDKDLFFHATELQGVEFDELREGDKVSFEVESTDRGPQAKNVKRA